MQDKAIIKVKVTDGNGDITYGTAYRINQTHAITALHVVEDYKSISFIFYDGSEESAFTCDYTNKDFDIALITFSKDVLSSLPRIRKTEIKRARKNDAWFGAGFPKYAQEGSQREQEELDGLCKRCPDNKNSFEISCDKRPYKKEWGGVSGAPVFVDNKLVGIILKNDEKLKGTYLTASAIWKLLAADKEFRDFFWDKDKSKKILKMVQAFLEDTDNEDLKNCLKNALDGKSTASEIVNDLTRRELPELLEFVKKLSADIDKRREFTLRLLPCYFIDQAVVIEEAAVALLKSAIDINCASEVAAECSVAAFSEREAHIDCIVGGTPYDNKLCVPNNKYALSPETGIGNDAADLNALTDQVLAGAALDVILEKRFASHAHDKEYMVNQILNKAQQQGDHFYLVVSLNRNCLDYDEKIDQIKKYKIKYPTLLILNLPSSEGAESEQLVREAERQESVLHLELPSIIS